MNSPSLKKFFNKAHYYIGEVAIVIIGIAIAVQLNNMNEKRKNEEEGKQSLNRIATELEIDKRRLSYFSSSIKSAEAKLKEIIYHNDTSHLDSMVFYLFGGFVHYPYNAEYINLKYSGKLYLIRNEELRNIIVRHYEVRYTALQRMSDCQDDFGNARILPYFTRTFPSDTTNLVDSSLVIQCLEDLEFRNLLVDQLGFYKQSRVALQRSNPEKILEMISEELQ